MLEQQARWWPVMVASKLNKTPMRVVLAGVPIALFRGANGQLNALVDRCPHRFAPLSEGRVVNGAVQCPYHGWTFNGQGECVRVPGLEQNGVCKQLVEPYQCQEAHGIVWLAKQGAAPSPVAFTAADDMDCQYFCQTIPATMQESLENFLDGFHTHFVHAGWIRKDQGRQRVRAERRCHPNKVEITYINEAKQNGVLSRFFEPSRGVSIGRYLPPTNAEIEYRDINGQLNLVSSLALSPASSGEINVCIRVATRRRRFIPEWLKRWLLGPVIAHVLAQDRNIITQVFRNQQAFASEPLQPLDTPLDMMSPAIRKGLALEPIDGIGDVVRDVSL